MNSDEYGHFEPSLVHGNPSASRHPLVESPIFNVELRTIIRPEKINLAETFAILAVASGEMTIQNSSHSTQRCPGHFCLIPASLKEIDLAGTAGSKYLFITPGKSDQ